MKKIVLPCFLLIGLLVWQGQAHAQQKRGADSLFSGTDSTAAMDSLMKEFDAFLDSLTKPQSFFSASVGMGNRSFSIKNNSLNTQESTKRISFTPSLAYYHRSGLGISATGFLANLDNHIGFYQFAATPSYDYIGRKIAAGISYTRYFGKDTATIDASPYDNDFYAYCNLRRNTWRFGIAAGYATGHFNDKISYADSVYRFSNLLQRYVWVRITKTIESLTHIKDFSLSASVRKDFEWNAVLTRKDNITASITAYLVSGASTLNTNTNLSVFRKKLTLAKFNRSFNSDNGNSFQLQSAALSASAFYTIGVFTIQPIWFMDYYFQDTDNHFSQVFSLTFAVNF
jgi:hypothetical protein